MRPRISLGTLFALFAAISAHSAQADVVVRSQLEPSEGVVVGQRVNLEVDVLFSDQMPHPPRVTLPDVPGMQIMQFATQGTTISARVNGANNIGKRFEFAIFPRRQGRFTLPAAQIDLLDVSGGVIGSTRGQPLTMAVAVPPGIDASGPVMAASNVTASQIWSPKPADRFYPGGALVRTINREAWDVPALAMVDFNFAAPDGVRVYVDPPQADDRIDRGAVTGRRIDKVTYVFEKPGLYDLPALSQPWWNLQSKSAEAAVLPGVKVSVALASSSTSHKDRPAMARRWMLLSLAGLVGVLSTLALLSGRLHRKWLAWRHRRAQSERAARRNLCKLARKGNASATYRALKTWLARLPSGQSAESVPAMADLRALADDLDRALFGSDGSDWTAAKGMRLSSIVASLTIDRHLSTHGRLHMLPLLNPATESSAMLDSDRRSGLVAANHAAKPDMAG